MFRGTGEKLGFGLRFEGGGRATECVRRLFIQVVMMRMVLMMVLMMVMMMMEEVGPLGRFFVQINQQAKSSVALSHNLCGLVYHIFGHQGRL